MPIHKTNIWHTFVCETCSIEMHLLVCSVYIGFSTTTLNTFNYPAFRLRTLEVIPSNNNKYFQIQYRMRDIARCSKMRHVNVLLFLNRHSQKVKHALFNNTQQYSFSHAQAPNGIFPILHYLFVSARIFRVLTSYAAIKTKRKASTRTNNTNLLNQ